MLNFYPRPPRGGRRLAERIFLAPDSISIHALREEGDKTAYKWIVNAEEFLSTPSARRATKDGAITGFDDFVISIHALREEGDISSICSYRSPL